MIGDPQGPDTGASQPLPPAYTRSAAGEPTFAAGEQGPLPPFFPFETGDEDATAPQTEPDRTVAPAVIAAEPSIVEPPTPFRPARPAPAVNPGQTVASGTIPADAIYMPDAEIPKRRQQPDEAEPDFGGPNRRPLSVSDAAVMVAARLELLSARLRQQGVGALEAGFGGDPLDAALSGLITGYIAGRAR